jgi:hypothetical protein
MNPHSKLIVHGEAAGGITASDVERRAREIALLDGRGATEPTREDRQAAIAELSGATVHPTLSDDGAGAGAATRDPSDAVVFYGHRKSDGTSDDEQTDVERLTLEGVEEAVHDQMVAAERRRHE